MSRRPAEASREIPFDSLAPFLDGSPDMIFIHGPDGALVDVNRQAEQALGYSREELLAMAPQSLMGSGHSEEEAFRLLERARAGEALDFHWKARSRDGEEIPVEVRLRALGGAAAGHVLAMVRDRRPQLEAERLQQAHLYHLEAMQRIGEAAGRSLHPDQTLANVIAEIRRIMGADRAWLAFPCDPDAVEYRIPVEDTDPAWPGAFEAGVILPMDADSRQAMQTALATSGAFDLHSEDAPIARRFRIRSQLLIAVRPRLGPAWLLGLHQCSAPRQWTPAEHELLADIASRLRDLIDAAQQQRAQEAQERRLLRFQQVLGDLARRTTVDALTADDAMRPITEAGARALEAARVSVWLLEGDPPRLRCADLYVPAEDRHEAGATLAAEQAPSYFAALSEDRVIAARDAFADPRTRELGPDYLRPWGIGALLEAPIRIGGRVVGVLCHAHAGGARDWLPAEQSFACSLADQAALALDYWERRQAEQRLGEAQRIAHIGSWQLDFDSGRLWWSQEIYRIFEIEPDAFGASYEAFLERVHPQDREALDRAYQQSVKNREPYRFDHRIRLPDGRIKHVREQGATVYDENGRPLRSVGTMQDITEQHAAEAAIRHSQAEMRAIFESISDALIFADPERRIVRINRGATAMFGYDIEELRGHTTARLYAREEDYLDQGRRRFNRDNSDPGAPYEMRYRRRDGSEFIGETLGTPVRDAAGRLLGYLGVIRDVTERHRAAAALRSQTELTRQVLRSTREGYLLLDLEGRIRDANPAYCRLSGYEREELLRMRIQDLAADEDSPPVSGLPGELEQTRAVQLEMVHRTRDGHRLELAASLSRLETDSGTMIAGFFRDVSAERARKLELEREVGRRTAQLRDVIAELESFSYSVSHDLRAPLRAIDGFSELVLAEHGDELGPEARDHLARVRRATQRMGELIDALLSLSHISRSRLHQGEVCLSAIARDIATGLQDREPGRSIRWDIMPGVQARGDSRLLRTLLENLLGNACKFTRGRDPARIAFRAFSQGEETVYVVEDNGAGFDMRYAGKLFGAFQRLHSHKAFEGTGIGLATVARIVRRHGGRIWAEAEPGRGARFYFTLQGPDTTVDPEPR